MENKVETALDVLNNKLNQPLVAALEVCARCGICTEACHYFVADPQPDHAPAIRAEKLRRIYRAEHDLLSRVIPSWTGAEKLTEERLSELAEMAFTKCTMCRRCTFNCPMGVDTPLLMSTIRAMASEIGEGPEILEMLADAAIEKGRNPEIYLDFYLDSIKDMEKDLQDLTGNRTARIPVQKQGAKMLYVALAGAHTILPAAAIFETVGEDWTLSIFESANYGVFLADVDRAKAIAKRIVDEANELGVEEIIISECGHAYASMRWTVPNWFGKDFNFRVRSIVEVIAEYIQQDRLSLDPSANPEIITYHDACNMARNGGVVEEPRIILNAITMNFCELIPNREEAYCCGGGGGLVAEPDFTEIRIAAGKTKVDQIDRSGAQLVAAACENCRLQLGDLSQHYGSGFGVISLADLVVKAMRLPGYRDSVEANMVESTVEDEARIQKN